MILLTRYNSLPKLETVRDQWLGLIDQLGAPGFKLSNQYAVTTYVTDVSNFAGLELAQKELDSEVAWARSARDTQRGTMVTYINGFIQRARAFSGPLTSTGTLLVLPKTVNTSHSNGRICHAGDVIATEWQKLIDLNHPDLPSPLTLNGGVTLAQFLTALESFRLTGSRLDRGRLAARTNRIRRNELLFKKLKPVIVEYRRRVKDMFPKDSPEVLNLPRITPLPGTTPDPVVLTGGWNSTLARAVLSWTACTHPDLDHYEIRACYEPSYHVMDDSVIGNVSKSTLSFESAAGLVADGSVANYKVYAVTKTEREKGSNTVKVIRSDVAASNAA
ncbi:MAG: hypothetical protein SFY80_14440 [Verrucomicrobiota bacterium]|nr:hypothetical protein [Verrucomicrobiota bacterium]